MSITAFFHYLAWVISLSPGHACSAVTQSTHSTYATRYGTIYQGTCIQSFLLALQSHGAVAWIIGG